MTTRSLPRPTVSDLLPPRLDTPASAADAVPVAPRAELLLLGNPGIPVPPSPKAPGLGVGKPLAVLAYLATSPGRSASRDQLTELLWADVDRESARHTLRQTVWYVKRRLGADPFIARGDTLTLADWLVTDRDAFLAALESGDHAAAVEAYRGDFFPGFAAPGGAEFEQWADLERRRLATLYVRAAEARVRELLGTGRARDAVQVARQARDLTPTQQASWRLLLEAMLAADDRAGALLEVDRLAEWLERDELGLDKATATTIKLVRSEVTRDQPAGPEGLVADLVGRDTEFAVLMQAWEDARRGTGVHVHVQAPAGLGKTRLLAGVSRRLRSARHRTVTVRATQANREIPYALAADLTLALARLRGAAGVSPEAAGALVALSPGVSAYLSAAPDRSTGDDVLRRRTLALQELIETIADDAPIAVLVDDLHWADAASVTLLESLLAKRREHPVLFVTASRQPDRQRDGSGTRTVTLAPLDVEQVRALVESLGELPEADWTRTFAERLTAASDGSPLLVLETLQLAIERNALALRDRRWHCLDEPALKASLVGGSAIRQRLGGLTETETDVLLLLAVLGDDLDEAQVPHAVGEEGAAALPVLEARGLLTLANERWRVAHDEIAARAIEEATPVRLARSHRQAATVFESAPSPDVNTLLRAAQHRHAAADHTEVAALFARVAQLSTSAGDRATLGALAQSIIGRQGTREQRDALIAGLPWGLRTNLGQAATTAAAALALLLAATALWLRAPAVVAAQPEVTLLIPHTTENSTTLLAVDFSDDATRDGTVLQAREVPVPEASLAALSGYTSVKSWSGDTVLGSLISADDALGMELELLHLTTGERRIITSGPGDEYGPSPFPEGTRIALGVGRWNPRQRSDLGIYDLGSGELSALTRSDEFDAQPVVSPDGTRVAFQRTYAAQRPTELCWVSIDARSSRCLPAIAEYERPMPLAWIDPTEVLASARMTASDLGVLLRVELETGEARIVHRGAHAYGVSSSGRFALAAVATPDRGRDEYLLFAVDRPSRTLPVRWHESAINPRSVSSVIWREPTTSRHLVERVAVDRLPDSIPADAAELKLSLLADTRSGRRVRAAVPQFESLDPEVAEVTLDGRLRPKAPGTVRIVGSAGGWRADTAFATVVATRFVETQLDEAWTSLDTTRWLLFGAPRPRLVQRSVLLDGDEHLSSGLVSWQSASPREGLGVEYRVRVPITEPQWQRASVEFTAYGTDAQLRAWSAREMDRLPRDVQQDAIVHLCGFSVPRGEGGDFASQALLATGREQTPLRDLPARITDGDWHTVRLQLFRDGRCGVAIDGQVVHVSTVAVPLDRALRLVLHGQSVGTDMRVGPLTWWRGERHDLPWFAVREEDDAPGL